MGDMFSDQLTFIGIYDGCAVSSSLDIILTNFRHGSSAVSQFLRQELHGLFESVKKADIPELYAWTSELGGRISRNAAAYNMGLQRKTQQLAASQRGERAGRCSCIIVPEDSRQHGVEHP